MIISNEPGFYKNKSFGIRIENLVLVKKSLVNNFFEFETLSLFPYELKLISFNLLNKTQKIGFVNITIKFTQKYQIFLIKNIVSG